jgi:hypothetical protein
MSKYFALAALSCALLFGGDKKASSSAQDRQKCLDGCTKTCDNCKKSATTKTAIQACEKSRDICRGACNK